MSSNATMEICLQLEVAAAYAIKALPPAEARAFEEHLSSCSQCQHEIADLQNVVNVMGQWPGDLLSPSESLPQRLALRIAGDTGAATPAIDVSVREPGSPWEEVAPGIFCKILSHDAERDRVSMLVRLAPGVAYPPHVHAEHEELHLLDGELWIEDRKLYPGDYYRAEGGSADQRVWSETGCTCVLMTSVRDRLG